jgi:hypothetical protein
MILFIEVAKSYIQPIFTGQSLYNKNSIEENQRQLPAALFCGAP